MHIYNFQEMEGDLIEISNVPGFIQFEISIHFPILK
jgi:hypothetical protein